MVRYLLVFHAHAFAVDSELNGSVCRPWQRASYYAIPNPHLLLESIIPAGSGALVFAVNCRTPALSCLLTAMPDHGGAASEQLPTVVAVDMALAALRLVAQEVSHDCAALTTVALMPGAGIPLAATAPALLECRLDVVSGAFEVSCGGAACMSASVVAVTASGAPSAATSAHPRPALNALAVAQAQAGCGTAVAAAHVPQEQAMFGTSISLMASSVLQHTATAQCSSSDIVPVLAAAGIVLPSARADVASRLRQLSLAASIAVPDVDTSSAFGASFTAANASDAAAVVSAGGVVHVQQRLQTGPSLPALQTVWVPCPAVAMAECAMQAQRAPPLATWALLSYEAPCSLETLVRLSPAEAAAVTAVNIVLVPQGPTLPISSQPGTHYATSMEEAAELLKALRPHHTLAVQLPADTHSGGILARPRTEYLHMFLHSKMP